MSVEELDDEVDTLKALYGVQPPTEPAALDAFRRDAAKAYAVALILERAAQDGGIVIADKSAQDVFDRYVSDQLGEGADARRQLVEALGNAGTSERAVLVEVKRQLAVGQLLEQVTRDVSVSDDDVASAFDERRAEIDTPELRHLANMVLPDERAADDAAARVRAGEPFAEVARQVSNDAATRDQGGDLGTVPAAPLEDAYAAAAFAATPNDVFGPVQGLHGWNVGTVLEVTPPAPAVYEQVLEPLRAQLELERSTQAWREWLAARISDAAVQYADAYRPADPDAPPATGPAAQDPAPAAPVPPGTSPPR
ncbi:peptidylprolyl isomerase [Pseudonocardia abyssalis]|uniref:peptidylprolyl isomerase n=1 Tax=Pseudonocardia abyssalis TaxID=2792008 RepID=A0ABS6URC6_9PSEU|nr:peptidylprolyl isomerase [Pseudonocardia abyssalis]